MNRREAFTAAGALLVPLVPNLEAAPNNKWHLIEERLSGKITSDHLKEYEFGYISQQYKFTTSKDNKLFLVNSYLSQVYNKDISDAHTAYMLVCANENEFFIKVKQESIDLIFKENKPTHPACLAYLKAYPMDNKFGDFYIIPRKWADCKKHPIVKQNVDEFKKGLELKNKLVEMQLEGLFGCYNHNIISEVLGE